MTITIGEIVTSPGAVVVYCILCLLIVFAQGPDLMHYFIERYDDWMSVIDRIQRRRHKK